MKRIMVATLLTTDLCGPADEDPEDTDTDTDMDSDTDTGMDSDTDTDMDTDSDPDADIVPLEGFVGQVLVSGLQGPWEVTWGPDDMLWVTERMGRTVVRIDPETGEQAEAVIIDEVLVDQQHQGLLGMALHPELLLDGSNNYVYVAYTYDETPGDGDEQDDPRAKVVRFTYDQGSEMLIEPMTIISGIPAGNDHNGGRLSIGPDGMLYYSLGEQGANQFDHFCEPIEAQRLPTYDEIEQGDWSAYRGKILRMELDGSIPSDNPTIEGVQSHIYSYGHRNPQGLAFGAGGNLYQVEHGANTDDEVNLIESGGNYGWPHVAGYRDNQSYAYVNWSEASNCSDLTWTNLTDPESIPDGVPRTEETDWTEPFVEPLKTLYTVPNSYDLEDETCGELFFVCRPSIAPSSVTYYPEDGPIPGWGPSLLVTALKNGAVYRFPLSGDRQGIRDTDRLLDTVNRYRDLAIGPDQRTLYVATDLSGFARAADGGATDQLEHPGAILVFTYAESK